MMDPQKLLAGFLGAETTQNLGNAVESGNTKLNNSGLAGVAGGVAAGGVLGLLLGNKKARKTVGKVAGGVAGYGGAAVLGALAYRAYDNWQENRQNSGVPAAATQQSSIPATPPPQASPDIAPVTYGSTGQLLTRPPAGSKFHPEAAPGSDGKPFELALILAMIGAANADGHIGPDEQQTIFKRVGEMTLGAEDKAFVFDALSKPPSLQDIADLAAGPEQAAELYLASRLAIDLDHPIEHAYLEALASRLSLPADFVQQLEAQVAALAQ